MKSQDCMDGDEEYLDDPMQFNFAENATHLDNLQFLDPGVIDLDCDSDEDCKYVDEDEMFLSTEDTSLKPVTKNRHNIVKPMYIKLVDCYKYPWYFDKPTKDIIKNKLVKNRVNITISGQIMDVYSEELENVADKFLNNTIDSNLCTNDVNSDNSGQIVNNNPDAFKSKTGICVNKEMYTMNRVHEQFNTRAVNSTKRMVTTKKRNDTELLKALSQQNKIEVDLKKNKGLVGMKIIRLDTKKQSVEMKNNPKKQVDTQKEKNARVTINTFYLQAADEALTNIGTTITPIFNETSDNTKESEPNISSRRDGNTDSSVKVLDSLTCNSVLPSTMEDDNNKKHLKLTMISEAFQENISKKAIDNTEEARETMKLTMVQNRKTQKPRALKNKLCKAMPLCKKIENQEKIILKEEIQSMKQRKNTEGCKMMTTPPPSSKERNKEKMENLKKPIVVSMKEAQEHTLPYFSSNHNKNNTIVKNIIDKTKSKDAMNARHEINILRTSKVILDKLATLKSDDIVPNKSFKTLNRFTKNILDKIKAKHLLQQSKINEPDKSLNKNNKICYRDSAVTPQTNKDYESTSIASITTLNVTKEDGKVLEDIKHSLEDGTKCILDGLDNTSPKISLTELQYSIINNSEISPKQNKSYPVNQVATTSLPLNTIIMKAAKTDDAKIDEVTCKNFVENAQPISTKRKKQEKQLIVEQLARENRTTKKGSRKQSFKYVPLEERNIEDYMKNKPMHFPPTFNAIETTRNKYTIQTIVTNRPTDDSHDVAITAVHNYVPKTQVSAIIIRPTQTQNCQTHNMKNTALTVHNSMQSHQIYPNYPEALQCMEQTNQPAYYRRVTHPIWYPSLYTAAVAPNTATKGRPSSGVRAPQVPMNNSTVPSTINGPNSSWTELNARSPGVSDARQIIPGANSSILHNSPPEMKKGIPPHVVMKDRPIPTAAISPLMESNARLAEINSTQSQMTINGRSKLLEDTLPIIPLNRSISPQMVSSGVGDIQPGQVFWSYAFPPLKHPPPPPPLPPSSLLNVFPFTDQVIDSSVIGRNKDGIVRKINITAPGANRTALHSKECNVKVEYTETGSTSLYDEISDNQPVITKSEMLRVLDTSMQQIHSPVKDVQGTTLITPKQYPARNLKEALTIKPKADFKSSPPEQRNEKSDYKSRYKLPQHAPTMTPSSYFKEAPTITPGNAIIDETITFKANQSSLVSFTDKPIQKSNLNQVPLTKVPPTNIRTSNFEGNDRTKRMGHTSPKNLKRTLPINEAYHASTVKYKPGPLSKKIKYSDNANYNKMKADNKKLPSLGYSSPILPIPTFEKILSKITSPNKNDLYSPVKGSKKKFNKADTKIQKKIIKGIPNKLTGKSKFEQNRKKVNGSKISLDEYKKRSVNERRTYEEVKTFMNNQKGTFFKDTGDMAKRVSNVDSDLGYDSDVTVKL